MIPFSKPIYFGNEREYLLDAFDSTWISGGKYIGEFENKFSEAHGGEYSLAVSNGTTALELAYLTLGLSPLGRVIVPSYGFMASANVAWNYNLHVDFADVDPDTWVVSAEEIEKKITSDTWAVVVIHSYGNVADMVKISDLCYRHKIYLIEDCAESIFSRYNGVYCGNFGTIGTFSFHATKTITTGEGGLIMTAKKDMYEYASLIRSHGMPVRGSYMHTAYGMNFRLTNLQAAIGLAQLEHKDFIIKRKKEIYNHYLGRLYGQDGIHFQKVDSSCDPVFWSVAVRLDMLFPEVQEVITELKNNGIETRPGFQTPARMRRSFGHKDPIVTPAGDFLSKYVIVLPSFTTITESEIDEVCNKLLECRKESIF